MPISDYTGVLVGNVTPHAGFLFPRGKASKEGGYYPYCLPSHCVYVVSYQCWGAILNHVISLWVVSSLFVEYYVTHYLYQFVQFYSFKELGNELFVSIRCDLNHKSAGFES